MHSTPDRVDWWIAIVVVALGTATAALCLLPIDPIADEAAHLLQVRIFASGEVRLDPSLTTVPLLEALLAIMTATTGIQDPRWLRVVVLSFGLAGSVAWLVGARMLVPEVAPARWVQTHFLPILFPFCFLVYTEALSVAVLGAALVACVRARYHLAEALAAAAVLVRQDNVIWVAAVVVAAEARRGVGLVQATRSPLRTAARHPVATAAMVAFAVFLAINRGVALGDQGAHPIRFSTTNIVLFLVLTAAILLPVFVVAAKNILRKLRSQPRLATLLLTATVLLGFGLALEHPYNKPETGAASWNPVGFVGPPYQQTGTTQFLHNQFVGALAGSTTVRWAVVALAGFSAAVIASLRFRLPVLPLSVAACVALAAQWLVEPRYGIVPALCLIVGRRPSSRRLEWLTAAWCVVLGIAVVVAIRVRAAFP